MFLSAGYLLDYGLLTLSMIFDFTSLTIEGFICLFFILSILVLVSSTATIYLTATSSFFLGAISFTFFSKWANEFNYSASSPPFHLKSQTGWAIGSCMFFFLSTGWSSISIQFFNAFMCLMCSSSSYVDLFFLFAFEDILGYYGECSLSIHFPFISCKPLCTFLTSPKSGFFTISSKNLSLPSIFYHSFSFHFLSTCSFGAVLVSKDGFAQLTNDKWLVISHISFYLPP